MCVLGPLWLDTTQRVEYDPNRSARIALVKYNDEEKATAVHGGPYSYILCPTGLNPGDVIMSGPNAPVKPGNALPLQYIPSGTVIHNVEVWPGKGGRLARSAGCSATLVMKQDDGWALVRLTSGEQRMISTQCMATVGTVSNPLHVNRKLGKAGASRWSGVRPTVRGVAMNPVDHPMGGGEGRSSGGRPSCSPWGKPTKGKRTRNNPRTDPYIRVRRHLAKKR